MSVPPRIQRLIDGRQLETVDPDPTAIVALWTKALASAADSRRGLSPDNAVSLGYQAAFQAASAVLEAAGYRTKGGTLAHHFNTFYAVSGLGLPGLEGVDIESERIRNCASHRSTAHPKQATTTWRPCTVGSMSSSPPSTVRFAPYAQSSPATFRCPDRPADPGGEERGL